MSWTSPRTWVAGEIVTAALMNTHVRDNERYLKGTDGEIILEDYLDFPSTAQGDIFYHNGTKLARLAAGTSGYVLKTSGAAANPVWAASILANAAAGLTPTATGWDTAPTTLTNATDGDLATTTGEGVDQGAAAETNDNGEVTIDLGANKQILRVIAKYGIRSAGGIQTNLRLRGGTANDLTDELLGTDATTSGSEVIHFIQASPSATATTEGLIRYISIRIHGDGTANNSYLKFYELQAFSV